MNARAHSVLSVLALAASVAAQAGAPAPAAGAQPSIAEKLAPLVRAVDANEVAATIRQLAAFGTRHTLSAADDDKRGIGAARTWLQAQFAACAARSGGRLTVALQSATVPCARQGLPKEVRITNVIATLRGTTDPERVYVVGGHYDSRNGQPGDAAGEAPGADDDASGTAVSLAACRAMAGTPFSATIVFCAYDAEELGLLGSQAHAAQLVHDHAQVDGMLGCDIVGNTLGMDGARYDGWVRCFSYAASGNDSPGRSLARAAAYAAREHVPGFPVRLVQRGDRYGRGGDHRSFFEQGFPAVRMTEPREDFSRQHQDVRPRDGRPYGDVPEFTDGAYAANVARVVVATLGELASAPPPPRATAALLVRDRYDTELTFALPPGVTDCEFVWRDTTAPDWQGARRLADVKVVAGKAAGTQVATLVGVCLDDCVVGVRSVGKDGSRSRVAVPPEPDRFDQRRASGAAAGATPEAGKERER